MSNFVVKYREFCEKNNIVIKPHQVYGVIWCLKQECKPLLTEKVIAGGILADEMGMGKTIQMIGLWMLNPQEKTLLIVPPILITQWHREIKKYTGHSACIYYGKDRARRATELSNAMVVITSYDTFWRDFSEGEAKSKVQEIVWDRIVCDEAHHLRNNKTKIYESLFTFLHRHATIKKTILWCLTGTPVQNSLGDLYSLFALFFLCKNKRRLFKEFPEELRDCFLQRKQNLLIEKREMEKIVEWDKSEEREVAKDIHQTIPFLGYSLEDGEAEDGWWIRKRSPILVSMIRAKQTCILSKMVESTYLSIPNLPVGEEIPEKIKTVFDNETIYSSKLSELLSLLESRKNNGNGKVLFCHYRLEIRSLLTLLMPIMNTEKSWVGEWRDYKRRSAISENLDWLGESPVLILPIQSGCEGLNLQKHFSEIYFVSPNWNPAMEAQAVARCHRIGQLKPVSVFRLSMNMIDTPENNRARDQHIRKYLWMTGRLSEDVLRYIDEFIGSDIPAISNASLDQYIFKIQREKRERIQKGMQFFLE